MVQREDGTMGHEGAAVEVAAVGTTGAVRGTDTAGERWDLLSPIAMRKVADQLPCFLDGLGEVPRLPKVALAGWFGSRAIRDVYAFLSGDAPAALVDAALNGLFASHLDRGGSYDFTPCSPYATRGAWTDLPSLGLKAYSEAMAEGAVKYKPFNYEKGLPVTNLLNHAIRHLYLRTTGDRTEDHLGHACWNLMSALHSLELWPHLNRDLRGPGCVPPMEEPAVVATAWGDVEIGSSEPTCTEPSGCRSCPDTAACDILRREVNLDSTPTVATAPIGIARNIKGNWCKFQLVVGEDGKAAWRALEEFTHRGRGVLEWAPCDPETPIAPTDFHGADPASPGGYSSVAQVQVPGGASASLPDVIHLGIDGTFVALERFGPGLWQGVIPGGSAATAKPEKLDGARPIGFSPSSGSFGAFKPGDPSYRMNPGNKRPGVYKVDGPPTLRVVPEKLVREGVVIVPPDWEYDVLNDWYTEPSKPEPKKDKEPTGDLSLVKHDMCGNRWVRVREVDAGRVQVPSSWELVRDQSGVGSDVYREPIPGRPAKPEPAKITEPTGDLGLIFVTDLGRRRVYGSCVRSGAVGVPQSWGYDEAGDFYTEPSKPESKPEEPTGASHLIVKLPDGRRAVRMAHVVSGHLTRPASWLPDLPNRMYVEPVAC